MNPVRLIARIALVALAAALLCAGAQAQDLKVRADHADAKYAAGDTATFRIEVTGADAASVTTVEYLLKKCGGTEMGRGNVTLADGAGTFQATLAEPGTVLAEVKAKAGSKNLKALAGAAFSFDAIKPTAPKPDDFDAFWAAKIKELAETPASAVLTPAKSPNASVERFQITMDGFRGTKIHGQLARPKGQAPRPALLVVQWAGVYPLQDWMVIGPAAEGFLVLNIMAHDLPINESEAFYKEQSAGPLKNYMGIGRTDREKNYFLRMYLSAYRAADYLASRPDWDGKSLAVTGTSQGGLQALMLAGLHPKVTAALANVPAGCDQAGLLAGRACGWPAIGQWLQGAEQKKVFEVSRYFDVVNFAAAIKCPVLVSAGMIDETCPPSGVIAAANQTQGPREIVILPLSDHSGREKSQDPMFSRMGAWRAAILQGKPLPPPAK